MTHNLASFDAAPYGVYRWAGEVAPGAARPENGMVAMGRGQWRSSRRDRHRTDKPARRPPPGGLPATLTDPVRK